MTAIHKLVRDRIPEIIRAEGRKVKVSILEDDDAFLQALSEKLIEEAKEFQESKNVEELADILEIILAILDLKALSMPALESLRKQKRAARGAFSQRFYLETTSP
ncbi:MAG: phosphoribosyl-ATP pyrophosphohydrolase [Candidatus Heimdallarchaeota archaeon]|nr:nucleoside triphosphate pyrophosphohydrolase [Candidatus Heimdallarchaeota archaeon]